MDIDIFSHNNFSFHPLLSRLLTLDQVPSTLYVRGVLPHIEINTLGAAKPRILTVVGSRNHSQYAEEATKELISALRGYPVIILSGLALGIDSLAHETALASSLITIGIPGSGLNDTALYPRTSERLAKEILYAHGALLSEFAPDTRAAKWMFLARNRLMAALADAVLIIEAQEKSGTLVTARHALELGKPIGCVVGSIFSDFNKGSHALIRDGATPIMDPIDLFSLLTIDPSPSAEKELPFLGEHESFLLSLLAEPRSKSDLLTLSKLSPPQFLQALTMLELEGLVTTSLHEVRKLV